MRTLLTGILICALTSMAGAYSVSFSDTVSFQSSKQAPKLATVASFDQSLYGDTLQSVTVEFYHKGSVVARVDNDDPYQGAFSAATMIRTWSATGPGVVSGATKTINGTNVNLGMDDGDGLVLDDSAPDGYDYTPELQYGPEAVGPYAPPKALYETAGPGTVQFTISPVQMSNILEWVLGSTPPDVWQREVQLPDMTIEVKVTYNYIPEPATLGLLSLGLAFFRRRFA